MSLVAVDSVGGDLYFANATEGEQELYEVFGRLLRGLFEYVTNSVGDRSLEHYSLGLEASEVDTHDLAIRQQRRCAKWNRATRIRHAPTRMPR
jgi:hypothetical protein